MSPRPHELGLAERFAAAARAHVAGHDAEAERGYLELLESFGPIAPVLVNLADVRFRAGRLHEAIDLLEEALDLDPDHINARLQLGRAYAALGEVEKADAAYAEALLIDPSHLAALNDRALLLDRIGRIDESIEHYRRAIEVAPERPEPHQNLSVLFERIGRLGDAIRHSESAIRLAPSAAGPRINLGKALVRMGRAEEGLARATEALASPQAQAAWHSNLLLDLHYVEGPTRGDLFEQHVAWASRWMPPPPKRLRATLPRSRRIRVGYLSPDLKSHAVAYFFEPLLAHHDRQRFELFAYASVAHEDAVSARMRAAFDVWHNVHADSDEAVAARVRNEGIDVLVDLAGHTAGHRLGVFALAPAPVQITYLGYPDTTGLRTMDVRITDRRCDPPGSEAFHTERLAFLESGMHCYAPHPAAPEPSRSPHEERGPLTFGSFSNTSKTTERVVARWSTVLRAIPSARMLMKFPTLGDPETADNFRRWFSRHGVDPERITLHPGMVSYLENLAAYSQVDVMLDTFPYCGTTTTCEALWMGVPVLSLVGDRHVSRVGLSLLEQVGLGSFAQPSESEWVARAVELDSPSGREELRQLRTRLRAILMASPLCDAPRKARELEDVYVAALVHERAEIRARTRSKPAS